MAGFGCWEAVTSPPGLGKDWGHGSRDIPKTRKPCLPGPSIFEPHFESRAAQNTRLLHPQVAHTCLKVADEYISRGFPGDILNKAAPAP